MHGAQAANRAQGAGFDQAQQFDLHRQWHLTNLVEEQRAAVGRFCQADLALVGTGKGSLLIAEQLALEQ